MLLKIMEEISRKILTLLLQMENLIRLLYVERQIKKTKGVFESPIPLSVTFKDAKKIDIQNPVFGKLLSQVNANNISDVKAKQLLGQAKDDEIQARLNRLRKRLDKRDDNNNNRNFDNSDVDDDDDNNNAGGDDITPKKQ